MAKKKTRGAQQPPAPPIRNRIKEHRRVRAGDLVPHEHNFRTHPDGQRDALLGLYREIGFARSLLAYELPDGRFKLIDGHLRRDLTPDMEVDVEVLDVSEDEARLLLASMDPLAALAEADKERLDGLLQEVQTSEASVQKMLAELAESAGIIPGMGGTPAPGQGGDEFDTEAALEGECRVKPGDLWLLGTYVTCPKCGKRNNVPGNAGS